MSSLHLSERDWLVLRSYIPDVLPSRDRILGRLRAFEPPTVAVEVDGVRMASTSLRDCVIRDLTVSPALRATSHKQLKVRAAPAPLPCPTPDGCWHVRSWVVMGRVDAWRARC